MEKGGDTLDNSTSRNMFEHECNFLEIQYLIRNVSSLEQNINDRLKKVNNKHTPETLYTIYMEKMYLA